MYFNINVYCTEYASVVCELHKPPTVIPGAGEDLRGRRNALLSLGSPTRAWPMVLKRIFNCGGQHSVFILWHYHMEHSNDLFLQSRLFNTSSESVCGISGDFPDLNRIIQCGWLIVAAVLSKPLKLCLRIWCKKMDMKMETLELNRANSKLCDSKTYLISTNLLQTYVSIREIVQFRAILLGWNALENSSFKYHSSRKKRRC